MIIQQHAYPRAGLIGNPSDGYFGKTMAFTFQNFRVEVTLYETPELEILPNTRDHSRFDSIAGLAGDVRRFGYYGGIRLLKAAVKRFYDHCNEQGIALHDRNFTLRYQSDIPHLVGLAGSSAIITACLRALMAFYGVTIPKPELANVVLAVEKDELGIAAGLQDRVAQVYQGLVFMDFDEDLMKRQGYGYYEPVPVRLLPPLYIAYRRELSEVSGVYHDTMRHRFRNGDPEVLAAIANWKTMTDDFYRALRDGDVDAMNRLLDANFDQRLALGRVSEGNRDMVRRARATGASAKFTGSGGAIIGIYKDEAMLGALREALAPDGIEVIVPEVAPPVAEEVVHGA